MRLENLRRVIIALSNLFVTMGDMPSTKNKNRKQ